MRRANLLTLRKFFNWKSNWYSDNNYKEFAFRDIMINLYLTSIFKKLRFPTSSFFIKHFSLNYILITADIYVPNIFRIFKYTSIFLSAYSQFLLGLKYFVNSEYEYHLVHKKFRSINLIVNKDLLSFLNKRFFKKKKRLFSFFSISKQFVFWTVSFLLTINIFPVQKLNLFKKKINYFDLLEYDFFFFYKRYYFNNGFFLDCTFFYKYVDFFFSNIFIYSLYFSMHFFFFIYNQCFFSLFELFGYKYNNFYIYKLLFLHHYSQLDSYSSFKYKFLYQNSFFLNSTTKYNYLFSFYNSAWNTVINPDTYITFKYDADFFQMFFFFDFFTTISFLRSQLFFFHNISFLLHFFIFNLELYTTDKLISSYFHTFKRLCNNIPIYSLFYRIKSLLRTSKYNSIKYSFFLFWMFRLVWDLLFKECYIYIIDHCFGLFSIAPINSNIVNYFTFQKLNSLNDLLISINLLNIYEFTFNYKSLLFIKHNYFFFNTMSMLYHYSYVTTKKWVHYLKYNYFFEFFNHLNTSIEITLLNFVTTNGICSSHIFFIPNLFLFWKPNISSAKMVCDYLYFKFKLRLRLNKVYASIRKWQVRERSLMVFSFSVWKKFKHLRYNKNPFFKRKNYKQLFNQINLDNSFFSELSSVRTQVKGIRIICSGPPYKAKRKIRVSYHVWAANFDLTGKMPLQTIHLAIDYYQSHVTLKRATLGLKIWLLFESYVKLK